MSTAVKTKKRNYKKGAETHKCKIIILNETEYGNSSCYYTVITDTLGRIEILVQGLRDGKGAFSGSRQLFVPLSIVSGNVYYNKNNFNHKTAKRLKSVSRLYVMENKQKMLSRQEYKAYLLNCIVMKDLIQNVVKEAVPCNKLFSFLEHSIIYNENTRNKRHGFLLPFIIGLSSLTGYFFYKEGMKGKHFTFDYKMNPENPNETKESFFQETSHIHARKTKIAKIIYEVAESFFNNLAIGENTQSHGQSVLDYYNAVANNSLTAQTNVITKVAMREMVSFLKHQIDGLKLKSFQEIINLKQNLNNIL